MGEAIEGVTLHITLLHAYSVSLFSFFIGTGVVVDTPVVVEDLRRSLWGDGLTSIAFPRGEGVGKEGGTETVVGWPDKQRWAKDGTLVSVGRLRVAGCG